MLTIANAVHQINEEIIDKEVRLIGSEGEQLGIMSAAEALKIAIEQDLDLVKIFMEQEKAEGSFNEGY